MKNILFYTPFTVRSRDAESVMLKFKASGYNVYYLSQGYGQEIQEFLSSNGILVFNTPKFKGRFGFSIIAEIVYLISFCWKHNIHVVFSHLETCNFIASVAQFFIKAKTVICRHHADDMWLHRKDHLFSYKFTYKYGKHFVVVSKFAKEFMVKHEKINPDKISIVNLAYDFSLFDKVDAGKVASIRQEFNCDVLLLFAGRLVPNKRPECAVNLIEALTRTGLNAKLLILGEGDLDVEIRKVILEKGLSGNCVLLGRRRNIMDYLSACDILIHPSISEASSVIVKEAGLVMKPVIVCSSVGDFEDYIRNKESGFIVSKEHFVEEATGIILDYNLNKYKYRSIGESLRKDVVEIFNIDNVFPDYKRLL